MNTGLGVIAEVADALGNSGAEVRSTLVSVLVTREKNRRVDILDKALVKRDQLQKEIYMVKKPGKAPNKVLNEDGTFTETPAVYTPEEAKKHEEEMKAYQKKLKEATEKLEKFDALMEECFTKPTEKGFNKLAAQVGGKADSSEG